MHVTELFGLDPKTLSASRGGFSFSHSGLMSNGIFVYRGVQKINLFTFCQFKVHARCIGPLELDPKLPRESSNSFSLV